MAMNTASQSPSPSERQHTRLASTGDTRPANTSSEKSLLAGGAGGQRSILTGGGERGGLAADVAGEQNVHTK